MSNSWLTGSDFEAASSDSSNNELLSTIYGNLTTDIDSMFGHSRSLGSETGELESISEESNQIDAITESDQVDVTSEESNEADVISEGSDRAVAMSEESYQTNDLDPPRSIQFNEESNEVDTISEESNQAEGTSEESNQGDAITEEPNRVVVSSEVINEAYDITQESNRVDVINEESNQTATADDCSEPPAKVRRISSPKADDTDGETCPICLDQWGNTGDHRVVALKCGHLFGSKCVQRWLKAQPSKDRSCPTCKSKATLKDVRFIYARRLVAADTSQLTSLQKQIDILQSEKSRCELELEKSKIAHRACSMQLEVLRSLMKSQANKEQPPRKSWRFALEKNLEICKDGGCRVLTYNCRTYELYVSQKSSNYLFPGYGIRKVSCLDYRLGQFVHLHPKPIRDITYSQPRDLLLSVGLDSSAKIMERGIAGVTVNTGMPLWSCSWDYLRSNEFYVGGAGVIHQYDVRNPGSYIQMLTAAGDLSPVVSLCSTEFGLLSCQLNSSWLWVGGNRQWEPRSLPLEGPFTSLCYDNETHRALILGRPSANRMERSKLTLCKLKSSVPSGEVLIDIEETFNGSAWSSLMSRASWVKVPGNSWVAAHSESDSTLYLHGLDGSRSMSLPAAEPALDIGCVELNGNTILAALSESRLRIYKAVPTNS